MRVIATAGHVDHGKSTLVRALTGMEPDRWEEERRRGLTMDLGFVWTQLDHPAGPITVAFVDVPGHHRFVTNMLSGAGAIDDALLVVAADDGWSAQSAEHLAILDLLEVRGILAAVTKADAVDPSRLTRVVDDVEAHLAATSLAGTPVVAIDSVSGRGMATFAATLAQRLLDTQQPPSTGDARLWIDRSFAISGAGAIVTGTVQGGPLAVGDDVQHVPSGRSMRIRGLHALGAPVAAVQAGARVAVNLARVSHHDLGRGDALVTGTWAITTEADVLLRSISDSEVGARGAWHLHAGAADVSARLWPLLGPLGFGETAVVRVEVSDALALRHGDRVILRDAGEQRTVAGGRVLDPLPGPRPRGTMPRLVAAESLEALAAETSPSITALLELHQGVLSLDDARAILGMTPDHPVEGVSRIGSSLVLDDLLARWGAAAIGLVAAAPADRGAFLSDALSAIGAAGCPEALRRAVIEDLRRGGAIRLHGDVVTTPAFEQSFLAARAARRAAMLAALEGDLLQPPDAAEEAERLGMLPAELKDLFEDGTLVHVGDVVLTSEAIRTARQRLEDHLAGRRFTASEAREVWGTTRKFAVPLLEHLAARGLTDFDGRSHRLRQVHGAADANGT